MLILPFSDGGQYSTQSGEPQDNYLYGAATITTPPTLFLPYEITLFVGWRPDVDNQGFGQAYVNLININNQTVAVCYFKSEPNNSISVYSGTTLLANSQQYEQSGFIFSYDTWYYIQFNVTLSIVLNTLNVGVSFAVYFNGAQVVTSPIDKPTYDTGIPSEIIQPVGSTPGVWNCTFESSNGFNSYSRVVLENLVGRDAYPLTRIPNVQVEQYPVEAAGLPTTESVRVSQFPVEVSKLPSTANVRISQYVIELVYQGVPVSGGWIVQEA